MASELNQKVKAYKKDDIIKKIYESKKGIDVLGTVNIDIDLFKDRCGSNNSSIVEELLKKIESKEIDYHINIITESLPQLAKISYASNQKAYAVENSNISLLREKKNSFEQIRDYFIRKECKVNIEPVEHVCADALNLVFYEHFIQNIANELSAFLNKDVSEIISKISESFGEKLGMTAEDVFRQQRSYISLVKEREFVKLSNIEKSFALDFLEEQKKEWKAFKETSQLIKAIEGKSLIRFETHLYGNTEVFEAKTKLKDRLSMLSDSALTYLYKENAYNYKQIRDNAAYKATIEREKKFKVLSEDLKYKQRLCVKNFCDEIYYQLIKIDDEYFIVGEQAEEKYTPTNDAAIIRYFENCLNNNNVAELTKKQNKGEVVPCYIYVNPASTDTAICNRYCVGQRARDAFYYEESNSMPFVKNVVWALVFDRNGNILLHKRGMNAKDNQDMWDKSVGGHISISDPNAIYGARREIIEELYTIEGEEQSHATSENTLSKTDPERIIFLGQWDEKRYPKFKDFLSDGSLIKLEKDEYYCFKFECPLTTNVIQSKRKLPSGKELLAKCFVDLFFVIVSEKFDLRKLQNSEYLCVPPMKVKEYRREGRYKPNDKPEERFDVTPDLDALLSDPIWENEITMFAKSVGDAFGK